MRQTAGRLLRLEQTGPESAHMRRVPLCRCAGVEVACVSKESRVSVPLQAVEKEENTNLRVHKSVYMGLQIFAVSTLPNLRLGKLCYICAVCVFVCVRPPAGSLLRALVRISCPLDTTSSVSMPPIDGRIDPLFDCLDNLCEFQHNASHSGFKDTLAGFACSCPYTC